MMEFYNFKAQFKNIVKYVRVLSDLKTEENVSGANITLSKYTILLFEQQNCVI